MKIYRDEDEIRTAFETQDVIKIDARFEWDDNIDVPDPENEGEEISVAQYWRVSGVVAKNKEAWIKHLRTQMGINENTESQECADMVLDRWLKHFCPDHPYPINCFVSYENDGNDNADEYNQIEGSGTYEIIAW